MPTDAQKRRAAAFRELRRQQNVEWGVVWTVEQRLAMSDALRAFAIKYGAPAPPEKAERESDFLAALHRRWSRIPR